MIVRKLRLKRGWTQSQLAEMAGVTTRTIQRIEQGYRPSLETSKALASVFEIELSILQPEDKTMKETNERLENKKTNEGLQPDEQEALMSGKRMKAFYDHLITYLVLAAVFLFAFHDEPVVYMIFAGLGIGLVVQGLLAFEVISFISPKWEKKLVEWKLGRKL
ncbi:XRE family transcriptional regulator [Aliidiomarina taiwanensis]|uniref:XRE family transcriptional regulator n=1 Tax=Aliidiomarina taiwanensis TaxID=946228 RepID=A0A432X9T5_9GAMM|nr:helix-turn-helix domain-containing protein [Aliidiomarina taiwanensis]RUO44147.1 XRE family transcriptional regulator [Aliidiomarina taiwanensis]